MRNQYTNVLFLSLIAVVVILIVIIGALFT